MSKKLNVASGIAVAATLLTAVVSTNGSDARAEAVEPVLVPQVAVIQSVAEPVMQTLPEAIDSFVRAPTERAATLADHVKAQPREGMLDREMQCLAGAIYFEARGETLAGQLAVGRVVVERSKSGRFPASYCGVVFQRSQFSFVRGQSMPSIAEGSTAWQNAKAIARIADAGSWESPAEGALFFHASHVAPGWRLKRLARVDNHVFYR